MPLGGAEILPDSLALTINIPLINRFCPECSILAIIGIFRRLSKLSGGKDYIFQEFSNGTRYNNYHKAA